MRKRVYTAGAMQAYVGSSRATQWRDEAESYFYNRDADFKIIKPTDYYEYGKSHHKTEKEIMRYELRLVKNADDVLVNLNDLRSSTGTKDEILYAYINDVPVIGFIDEDLSGDELVERVHPWKYEQCERIETGTGSMKAAIDYIIEYYGET